VTEKRTFKRGIDMNSKTLNKLLLTALAASLIVTFFIPFVQIKVAADVVGAEKTETVSSLFHLMLINDQYTQAYDFGLFSKADLFSLINLFWLLPLLAVSGLIAAFFLKEGYLKFWIYLIGSIVLTLSPVYGVLCFKSLSPLCAEVQNFRITIGGFVFPAALGLLFLFLSSYPSRSTYKFMKVHPEREKEIERTLFVLLSFFTLLSLFLPAFIVDYRVGMRQIERLPLGLVPFLGTAGQIKVAAIFSILWKFMDLKFIQGFIVLPFLCLASIALLLMKKIKAARIVLTVQGILSLSVIIMTINILKTNITFLENISRVAVGSGFISQFILSGVTLFALYKTHSNGMIQDPLLSSRKRHDQGYIILCCLFLLVIFSPQFGVKAVDAAKIHLINKDFPDTFKLPFNMFQTSFVTGTFMAYTIYLSLVSLLGMILARFMINFRLMRILAMSAGALLVLSCFTNYYALSVFVGEVGTIQIRLSYFVALVIGILLMIQGYTDKANLLQIQLTTSRTRSILLYSTLFGFAVIQLYPLFWLFLASFMSDTEIFSGRLFLLPDVWHVENYAKALFSTRSGETLMEAVQRVMGSATNQNLFKYLAGATPEGNIIRYFGNSLFVVAISVSFIVLFSAMAAYGLVRIKWKGQSTLYIVFMLGMMIPVHVALAPLYISFSKMGILGTLWSLIIPYIGFGLPLAIIVFYGFMGQIPFAIEEAAFIDGAGRIRIFFQMILPISAPSIATVTIFSFLSSWNELMFATTFINKGLLKTITVGVYHLADSQYRTEYGLMFAGLIIASLPTMIYYLLASEQVQKSLTQGSIKG
jgi:raffinose/stachyose/melibiose transport system permease protein